MNKIIVTGNLTKDPDYGETSGGVSFCKFSVAVNRSYTNSEGERQTDFFPVTAWRGLADNCGKYLKKGSKVLVSGSLQNRSYEDKDGNKRTVSEIVANDVEFLTPKQEQQHEEYTPPSKKKPQLQAFDDDEDLPF